MNLFTILIALFLIIKLGKTAVLNENLIRGFFEEKYCNLGTILNCNTKQESLLLIKNVMSNGYRISVYDITKPKISAEKVLSKGDYNLGIIIDADCLDIRPFLNEAATLKYFVETYHWLILTSDSNIYEKYQKIPLNINSDVTIAMQVLNEKGQSLSSNWTIFDIYNPAYKHGGKVIIEKLGLFDGHDTSVLKYTDEPRYHKRRNMSGILFQSGIVFPENTSMTVKEHLASDKDRHMNTISRLHSSTIDNCQDHFGFIVINISLTNSWGYLRPNREVDGMLKELKENRIDFGISPLLHRSFRVKMIDYGTGITSLKGAFFFQHPKTTSSSYKLYLRPLVYSVWLTTMGIIVLIIITLRVILIKQAKVLDSTSADNDGSWSFLIMYGIGELCQQGFSLIPTFLSGKIVTFTVLLFSFMIYQFYSASIVSFLLSTPAQTIKTLEDLLNSPLEAGCEDTTFDKNYFLTTTNPVAVELYRSKIIGKNNHSNFLSPDIGFRKVIGGGYAYHAQLSAAYLIIDHTFPEKIICSVVEVELYQPEYLYMVTPKHSAFIEMFNYCLLHQMEVGIINRLQTFWHARKPTCLEPMNYLEVSVGLTESYWGLMLLGCGYLISLNLLVMELFWKRGRTLFIKRKLKKIHNKLINVQFFPKQLY